MAKVVPWLTLGKEAAQSLLDLGVAWFLAHISVMAFPTIFSVVLSLTNYNGGKLFGGRVPIELVGLKWYQRLIVDEYFYLALKNNLWIVMVSVFGQIPLGFFLAYVLYRGLVKGRDFFQTMIYLPTVISTVVIGILWKSFFAPHGAFPELMRFFMPGYEYSLSQHPMIPVLFVILWMYAACMIIFIANLQKSITPSSKLHRWCK